MQITFSNANTPTCTQQFGTIGFWTLLVTWVKLAILYQNEGKINARDCVFPLEYGLKLLPLKTLAPLGKY